MCAQHRRHRTCCRLAKRVLFTTFKVRGAMVEEMHLLHRNRTLWLMRLLLLLQIYSRTSARREQALEDDGSQPPPPSRRS
jgi:hypothetical protein